MYWTSCCQIECYTQQTYPIGQEAVCGMIIEAVFYVCVCDFLPINFEGELLYGGNFVQFLFIMYRAVARICRKWGRSW